MASSYLGSGAKDQFNFIVIKIKATYSYFNPFLHMVGTQ